VRKTVNTKNIIPSALLATASFVCGTFISQQLEKHIIDFRLLIVVLVFLSVIMNYYAVQNMQSLFRGLGFYAQYYGGRTSEERRYLFQRATEIVMQARESISVVNTFKYEYYSSSTEENEDVNQAKREYYDALVRSSNRGVKYRRIVQIPSGKKMADIVHDKLYIEHFRRIIESQKEKQELLSIKLSDVRYSLPTFAIIDGIYILIQLDGVDKDSKSRMSGIIIIYDPQRMVTEPLCRIIDSIDNQSKALQEADLPSE